MSALTPILTQARAAAVQLADSDAEARNQALIAMAKALRHAQAAILDANRQDVQDARAAGQSAALIDRLTLTEERIDAMAEAVLAIAKLPDPLGDIYGLSSRPNGLRVGRMRVPLGVIGIIFESRPNVIADAAALCVKSGNAVILRGGSEAKRSNAALGDVLGEALAASGLPAAAAQVLRDTDRALVLDLLTARGQVDLVIPRGGEGLIRFVDEHARVPIILHYKGVCHVFVDGEADLDAAERIILNAKTQRPGVCNAAETLLVHADVAETFLPTAAKALREAGVELRGCERACALVSGMIPATEADWPAEYLDLILAVKVVDDFDAAVAHIRAYGSGHTEAIVTENYHSASRFLNVVDASCVVVNASTRFNDGGELGLGAEMGISTTKLHAYGPMGLQELTTSKFIVLGQGQVRG